jgi:hypothetical protein
LAGFSKGIPFLDGIVIKDGKFAFFKGTPSAQVFGTSETPPNVTTSSVVLSGKLLLGGSSFMELISSIVSLDEVDICVLPSLVSIGIPAASLGLNIMDVFKVKLFSLEIFTGGFDLGAVVELNADWLSPTPRHWFLHVAYHV